MGSVIFTVNAAWNIKNFRMDLVDEIVSAGYDVRILAPEDDSVPHLEAVGLTFHDLLMNKSGLNPFADLGLLYQFISTFRAVRPDLVFSYTIKNNVFGALASKVTKTPFVPTITGLGTAFLSGNLTKTLAKVLYRVSFSHLPVIIFQNNDDISLFLKHHLIKPSQVQLVNGSGVNIRRFTMQPKCTGKTTRFLYVGRMIADKGLGELVEAARQLKAKNVPFELKLLGGLGVANRTSFSNEQIRQWESEGLIEYLGETDDVRPYLRRADCVVLPSYREGLPRSLIEAAAAGRPIVTTDVPGCREVVVNHRNGLLCEVKNVCSLARAMEDFVNLGAARRRKMGEESQKIAMSKFDSRNINAVYLRTLEDQI